MGLNWETFQDDAAGKRVCEEGTDIKYHIGNIVTLGHLVGMRIDYVVTFIRNLGNTD